MKTLVKSNPRGFTLFEITLALAIFTTAALALVQALNLIGTATHEADEVSLVYTYLESLLTETCLESDFEEGVTMIDDLLEGVIFKVDIAELVRSNANGETLEGLFRVRITAFENDNKESVLGELERIVNPQLWSPQEPPLR